jgi:cytoskeletal protein CcmA (bactofilin family)
MGGAAMTVNGTLEVCKGASLDFAKLTCSGVLIRRGAVLRAETEFMCDTLDIAGELAGKVAASGSVVIRRGGLLRGDLRGEHLTVEDGGGVVGRLRVQPGPGGKRRSRGKKA